VNEALPVYALSVLEGLRKRFKDIDSDQPLALGTRGVLTIATRGKDGPGEVQVELNGASTTFIAYSDNPLECGAQVVIYDVFGGRKVSVERVSG
jgi:membrane protein implicated in regulation of membrane protease activity